MKTALVVVGLLVGTMVLAGAAEAQSAWGVPLRGARYGYDIYSSAASGDANGVVCKGTGYMIAAAAGGVCAAAASPSVVGSFVAGAGCGAAAYYSWQYVCGKYIMRG